MAPKRCYDAGRLGEAAEEAAKHAQAAHDDDVTLTCSYGGVVGSNELKQKAMKRVIDICEDSINRDDVHMTIQCDRCAKCRTCRDIRKINASSYNDFVEQKAMEQLVEFVEGKDGKPGYFTSPLPLKCSTLIQ